MTTGIEWVRNPDGTKGRTWNPILGCTHVSEGCDNCYAARLASGRLKHRAEYEGLAEGGKFTGKVRLLPERLDAPLRVREPTTWFVNSMSDLWHDEVPADFIAEVFGVMAVAGRYRHHVFQVLTKRPGRMASVLGTDAFRDKVASAAYRWAKDRTAAGALADDIYPESRFIGGQPTHWPLPNVWLGVSVESQKWADVRIPKLLETPAAVRFLSCEPLLGPVNLAGLLQGDARVGIDWVIVGGESGPGARPMHPDWARSLRDQCVAAGVPFFFKQWGEWAPHHDGIPFFKETAHRFNLKMRTLFVDGTEYNEREPDGWLRPDKAQLWRIGKKRAGRELDGRTWDEMP